MKADSLDMTVAAVCGLIIVVNLIGTMYERSFGEGTSAGKRIKYLQKATKSSLVLHVFCLTGETGNLPNGTYTLFVHTCMYVYKRRL